ncbi:MAG TPA: hypothetical protein VGK17_04485 [Propionicimonas sp.]
MIASGIIYLIALGAGVIGGVIGLKVVAGLRPKVGGRAAPRVGALVRPDLPVRILYTAWLTDPQLPPDDEDREWPACFIVVAADQESARQRGDHLAREYATSSGQVFTRSAVEAVSPGADAEVDRLPVIRQGEEAPDEQVGW